MSTSHETIPFSRPTTALKAEEYIHAAIAGGQLSGDGPYSRQCEAWLTRQCGAAASFLTPSCTHALEAAAILCGIQPGDEVIMPSYTFVSTANAFVLRGAQIRFVDIRPDTQNIDENLIEAAITPRTRAIVPVHYAGVGCRMDAIMEIAGVHRLHVIEDAAQALRATYCGKPLGSLGDYGCISFHATKNYTMGEGGALLIRDEQRVQDAAILREKGTNRAAFLQGMVDKYTWVAPGTSCLPSELSAALLWAQLEDADRIDARRMSLWQRYAGQLRSLEQQGRIVLPHVPPECRHNAHMFYIKTASLEERLALTAWLKERGVTAAFHYVPLHTSPQGRKCGVFVGEDRCTTDTFHRLLRLPMYDALTFEQVDRVCQCIHDFYRVHTRH